ncbi:MAG: Hpt domain-containing protein [Sphingopyxis sp.]|uniref:Hpt domain-containing protein n=1 Tax=Sphingopyxis sp. TaxID=1908224 RepID=UPI002ABC0058|nr:Hpt domain-containing protein [Sphingopyxis sp.]MDZ3830807.1 Hpt domain-containing protein [Sphingopyxis sp.]
MDLIDEALVREQFDALDPATTAELRDAIAADLRLWAGRLCAAWAAADAEGISRARHALKGLCGNFGATGIDALAAGTLETEPERVRLGQGVEETIAAIERIAGPAR